MPDLDLRGILETLERRNVAFVVIGGVAVGFHGYVRATKDVDIVPSPDPENIERLAQTLRDIGARVEGGEEFEPKELGDPLDPTQLGAGNWKLETRLGPLDILQWAGEVSLWERLAAAAIEVEVAGVPLRVAAYDDLVELKRAADRAEDRLDLQRLREARGEA